MLVFDHISCHATMTDDALEVGKMNVKPGGKLRIMYDTKVEWQNLEDVLHWI